MDEIQLLKKDSFGGDALAKLSGLGIERQAVLRRIKQVSGSPLTCLIQGETGIGKEIAARAIHQGSPRRNRPFLAIDCGALPENLIESELFGFERGAFTGADRRKEGIFQLASGGTLLLDEVANLPSATQGKLLRVLQERQVAPVGRRGPVPFDVRLVVACNVALEDEMRASRFRQDLFYRLDEFRITLPPLRARRDCRRAKPASTPRRKWPPPERMDTCSSRWSRDAGGPRALLKRQPQSVPVVTP